MQRQYSQIFRIAFDFLTEYSGKAEYSEKFFEEAAQRLDDILHLMPQSKILCDLLIACYEELNRVAKGDK